jgi:hypothetical protein
MQTPAHCDTCRTHAPPWRAWQGTRTRVACGPPRAGPGASSGRGASHRALGACCQGPPWTAHRMQRCGGQRGQRRVVSYMQCNELHYVLRARSRSLKQTWVHTWAVTRGETRRPWTCPWRQNRHLWEKEQQQQSTRKRRPSRLQQQVVFGSQRYLAKLTGARKALVLGEHSLVVPKGGQRSGSCLLNAHTHERERTHTHTRTHTHAQMENT